MQIKVQQGKHHEFVSLTKQLQFVIEDKKDEVESNPELLKQNSKYLFDEILYTATKISDYSTLYHKSTGNMLTSINNEIEMSIAYRDIFSFEQNKGTKNVINIYNLISDDILLNEIKIPSHLLNNFIMNSINHGTKGDGNKTIDINISSLKNDDGYTIVIEDNGCGINYTKRIASENGIRVTGLTRAKDIIDSFNKRSLEYKILLPDNAISDKSDLGLGKGTIVTIKLISNDYQSINC